jgi:hypothetical protein
LRERCPRSPSRSRAFGPHSFAARVPAVHRDTPVRARFGMAAVAFADDPKSVTGKPVTP